MNNVTFMKLALDLAHQASIEGEVPVGAVVVDQYGRIIASSANKMVSDNDNTQHAELIAIKNALFLIKQSRLIGCSIYTTLEPCLMCLGLMINTRMRYLYFSTNSPLHGAFSSAHVPKIIHPHLSIDQGLFALQSHNMLQGFFKSLRYSKVNNFRCSSDSCLLSISEGASVKKHLPD